LSDYSIYAELNFVSNQQKFQPCRLYWHLFSKTILSWNCTV